VLPVDGGVMAGAVSKQRKNPIVITQDPGDRGRTQHHETAALCLFPKEI